ncbi:delta-type opioid receptor-like [Trichogramma pretiosum]|uniref:delta-type opioid receptor-like n=1 Tax=Trichogramma pretiosum TaxID=7493 RepID=UPI0006C991BF|nr:delta-type opioid receptor-like [Trichogramma pretiosum]
MNSSYVLGEDEDWGRRYYFTYYSEFGDRNGASGVEVLVLGVCFVVAVIANLGIAACALRYREMRTPTNLCLVNLAAADLLFALGVPAVAYTRLTQSWRLGELVCRLLPYSQFVCGFVLLWTLTLISMDRHRCLAVAPYRSALTRKRVVLASFLTWFIAAMLFLPAAFWFRPMEVSSGQTICTLVFPRSEILNISLFFILPIIIGACLLPMTLLVYHYQRIFQRILDTRNRWAVPCVAQGLEPETAGGRRRDSELSVVMGTLVPSWAGRKLSSASMQGSCPTTNIGSGGGLQQPAGRQVRASSLSQTEEIRLHKHLRVVRILLLNVAAVLAMWLPITILMILIYVDGRRPIEDVDFFLRSHHFIWALVTAQFNTVVNPLLYGVLSENFRACFAKLWRGRGEPGRTLQGQQATKNGANNNPTSATDRTSGGGGAGGGATSRTSSKTLGGIQDRLGAAGPAKSGSFRSKSSGKNGKLGIGSIIELPASEKS